MGKKIKRRKRKNIKRTRNYKKKYWNEKQTIHGECEQITESYD